MGYVLICLGVSAYNEPGVTYQQNQALIVSSIHCMQSFG